MSFESFEKRIARCKTRIEDVLDACFSGPLSPKHLFVRTLYFLFLFSLVFLLSQIDGAFREYNRFSLSFLYSGLLFIVPTVLLLAQFRIHWGISYGLSFFLILWSRFHYFGFPWLNTALKIAMVIALLIGLLFTIHHTRGPVLKALIPYEILFWLLKWLEVKFQLLIPHVSRVERALFVASETKTVSFKTILHPTNFIYPIPMGPAGALKTPKGHYYLAVLLGFVFLIFAVGIGYAFEVLKTYDSRWAQALTIWLGYIFFLLNSTAMIGLANGIAGISGLTNQRGTDMSFFATSPVEHWRRWNIPFYHWFFTFIYIPVFRRVQSHFLAIMTVFLATFYFHSAYALNDILFDIDSQLRVISKFNLFMAHGLACYLTLRFPSLFKKNTIGFLLNQIVMSAIYFLG